jgi:hypothetical protein
MKKLVAALAVTGLIVAGGGAAYAAGPGGNGGTGGSGSGAAQNGRRGHGGVRLALQTAATTIGVSPQELGSQVRSGKTVAAVATEHGVDPANVVNAVVAALTQRIDEAVAQGKVDAARAEQAKAKLPDFANRFVNETKAKNGERRGRKLLGDAVDAAAKEIGVSKDDLKSALKDGKSIAQVAKDHNKSVDDVVDAIVKAATSDIDQAVTDGKLDSTKADQIKKNLPDHAKELVNRQRQNQSGSSATPGTQ